MASSILPSARISLPTPFAGAPLSRLLSPFAQNRGCRKRHRPPEKRSAKRAHEITASQLHESKVPHLRTRPHQVQLSLIKTCTFYPDCLGFSGFLCSHVSSQTTTEGKGRNLQLRTITRVCRRPLTGFACAPVDRGSSLPPQMTNRKRFEATEFS